MSDERDLIIENLHAVSTRKEGRIGELSVEVSRLRGVLERWLAWPGRSEDETHPLETETAKLLGHTDECELLEYGVCTCARAALSTSTAPAPDLEPIPPGLTFRLIVEQWEQFKRNHGAPGAPPMLDPETIEACAREADDHRHSKICLCDRCNLMRDIAARIRSLVATPGAKP